jgi:hypothetical protein
MKLQKYEQYRKRFPYFKVQWYDYRSKVWREIQKSFPTETQAGKHGQAVSSKFRIVKITREGRGIV